MKTDRKQILDEIIRIIKENVPELADKELTEKTTVSEDISFDSLTFTYVMCKIEAEYDIKVPTKKWDKMKDLGDVVTAVEKEIRKK